jgi:hypothetical protein
LGIRCDATVHPKIGVWARRNSYFGVLRNDQLTTPATKTTKAKKTNFIFPYFTTFCYQTPGLPFLLLLVQKTKDSKIFSSFPKHEFFRCGHARV